MGLIRLEGGKFTSFSLIGAPTFHIMYINLYI